MIVTTLSDASRYERFDTNIGMALRWLAGASWSNLQPGEHSIRAREVYAIMQQYDTKEDSQCIFESHRLYTDIQMVLSGREIIQVASKSLLIIQEPYREDIEFYRLPTENGSQSLLMKPYDLAIFFPEDAHRPCMQVDSKSEAVRKLVIKVALSTSSKDAT